MRLPALILVVAAAACAPTPPELADCAGPVAGVWRDAHGRRWHLWQERDGVEVFPMWDSSVLDGGVKTEGAPLSPLRIRIEGAGGWVSQRVGDCTVKRGARLDRCRGRTAVLSLERGPLACDTAATGWIELRLVRE